MVLMDREDLSHVAPLWLDYSERVREDPLVSLQWGGGAPGELAVCATGG